MNEWGEGVAFFLGAIVEGKSTSATVEVVDPQLVQGLEDLVINVQYNGDCSAAAEEINQGGIYISSNDIANHHGVCAICLNKIVLQETAFVKGCEHAYCANCILRWASCKKQPKCPQCKNPFEFLHVHRALDGRIHHYMFEESVCLLLRASWFKPLVEVEQEELDKDCYYYEDEEEDPDEFYLGSSSSLRIGNRRWGDNGYVRAGRQEARPIHRSSVQDLGGAGPSHQPRKKENPAKERVGRRAKRALKREAANKAAAEKHQQHLMRLGRK